MVSDIHSKRRQVVGMVSSDTQLRTCKWYINVCVLDHHSCGFHFNQNYTPGSQHPGKTYSLMNAKLYFSKLHQLGIIILILLEGTLQILC